jgi:predicted transglutaminase-like cysteine proteinase
VQYCKKSYGIFLSVVVVLAPIAPIADAAPSYRHMNSKALNSIEKTYGKAAKNRIARWSQTLDHFASSESVSDGEITRFANDYFNQIEWKWDIDHWGVEDYWATPVETLGTYAGDCEDFSIGKYFSLISMGMDSNKLRITYVKALELNLAHMVLAYYPTPRSEPLILDNINQTILPASQRKDLLPVYGFNGDGIWLAKSTKRMASGKNIAKSLPSWGRLNKRMRKELL